MENVIVSIIVPVYKVERYIDRCIDSLINQTEKNIEIILVDDGSPDTCPQICDNYAKMDSRIKVVHKQNEGLGFARNSGLDVAKGKYIGFVDSDDSVKLDMVATLLHHIEQDNCDIVIAGYTRVNSSGKQTEYNGEGIEKIYTGNELHELIIDMVGTKPSDPKDMRCDMAVWKCLFSREFIQNNSLRFPSEREFISEDLIFQIDAISCAQRVKTIKECVYYYYDNIESLTNIYNPERLDKNIILCKEIKRRLASIYGVGDEIFVDRLMISRLKTVIVQIIKSKMDWKKELELIRDKEEVIELLKEYPINQMVWKQRLFYLSFKYRLFSITYMLVVLKYRY